MVARAGDQRAERSVSSLPGAGRRADLQRTLRRLDGLKLAFVGDGNNVAHSLMLTAAAAGHGFRPGAPGGLRAEPRHRGAGRRPGRGAGTRSALTNDPPEAVAGAHAVYTDVWASMGQEAGSGQARCKHFAPYQVNEELFAQARPDAIFMHCLPAKRGEEVTDAVMESPRSVVFDQAENRLHAQKALLLMLLSTS